MTDEVQPYQRVVKGVTEDIRLGRLRPNDQLPSTRELADQYGVALGTVQRALSELKNGDIIYSHQGKGSFVREDAGDKVRDPHAVAIAELRQQMADMAEQMADLTARLDRYERGGKPTE
jgi:DNA-binding transcriptional regulator YhcF (GntR family)